MGKKKYRIMSFDGTGINGGSGWVAASLLKQVHSGLGDAKRMQTELLDKIDLFAGSSAGSWNALFMAHYLSEPPSEDIDAGYSQLFDDLMDFWKCIVTAFDPKNSMNACRSVSAGFGQSSLFDTSKLREVFENHFEDARLGDLKRKVMVPAFQLDSLDPKYRRWKAKIFHNFSDGSEPDSDCFEFISDVAMRSSAIPILTPIYQGKKERGPTYADGGIFANNPSMCAISQVMAQVHKQHQAARGAPLEDLPDELGDIVLFSLGNGVGQNYIHPETVDGFARWGYQKWMFDLDHLLLLVDVMIDSAEEVVTHYCRQLLRTNYDGTWVEQFMRIQPFFHEPKVTVFADEIDEAMEDLEAHRVTKRQVHNVLKWLRDDPGLWFADSPKQTVSA